VWDGGIVGSWEGYIGRNNDLYYNGANRAEFKGDNDNSTFSDFKFESNQINIRCGGNSPISLSSTQPYNVTPYKKLSILFVAVTAYSYGFNFRLDNPGMGVESYTLIANGYQTVSFNLSSVQLTSTVKISMTANRSGLSQRCAYQRVCIQRIFFHNCRVYS